MDRIINLLYILLARMVLDMIWNWTIRLPRSSSWVEEGVYSRVNQSSEGYGVAVQVQWVVATFHNSSAVCPDEVLP